MALPETPSTRSFHPWPRMKVWDHLPGGGRRPPLGRRTGEISLGVGKDRGPWGDSPQKSHWPEAPEKGRDSMVEVMEFMPGLWLVESQLEDFQVRGAVIAGSEKLLVWDTLARPADMKGIADLAPSLPLVVVYSHADWDHVLGTSGLARTPTEVVGHRLAIERFSQELPGELEERRAEDPQEYEEVKLVPPTRVVPDAYSGHEGLSIELGGLHIELHALPGHTPDSIVCFVPEWGVLFGGDSVETPLPFLNPGSPLRAWSKALTAWAERLEASPNPAIVIPSHGRVGGPELLRENVRYLDALLARKDPNVTEHLTPFYRETHGNNIALARGR